MYSFMSPIILLIYFVKIVRESVISQRHIQNLAKHLIWNFFQKYLTVKKFDLQCFAEFCMYKRSNCFITQRNKKKKLLCNIKEYHTKLQKSLQIALFKIFAGKSSFAEAFKVCPKQSNYLNWLFNMLLASIHQHPFYKHNFRQRFEAKIPRHIGVVLLSYKFSRNSVCSRSRLKLIFRSDSI